MTHYDYKLYMKNRQRLIDLKRKGKREEIPAKVKAIKYIPKWDLIEV